MNKTRKLFVLVELFAWARRRRSDAHLLPNRG